MEISSAICSSAPHLRDAIVLSGWEWETFNAPERVCLALASLGMRVLHCQPPISVLRARTPRPVRELQQNIYGFQPTFLGSRANGIPILRDVQAAAVRKQICHAAQELNLRDPILIYSWLSNFFLLPAQMGRSHYAVHLCIDDIGVDPNYERYVQASDLTLVIPRSCYHKLKAKFGEKVKLILQPVDITGLAPPLPTYTEAEQKLNAIPRPRLGYLGLARFRLNKPVLATLLQAHPEWHFVSIGAEKVLALPNAHALPWASPVDLWRYARSFDVGFMPYDGYLDFNLHCVPLKLFEYFALGMPVVSTPMIHLWEYKDLIYFGDAAEELALAIEAALNEPFDSPKRAMRIEIARKHSLENLASELLHCLPLESTKVA